MSEFRADLHCHTFFSDGSDSPEEILALARAKGLSALSVTDHDTIEAYHRLVPLAKEMNFPLLPGIELSTTLKTEAVHILGYAFSLENKVMAQLIERQQQFRIDRNIRILEKLRKMGIVVTEEEMLKQGLQKTGVLGRPHIAAVMIEKGVVSNFVQAFDRYLGEGKPAYEMGVRPPVEEVIGLIHEAGGKAILAHPHLIHRKRILKALYEMPFDGLEGYYAKMGPAYNQPFLNVAQEKGWIVTGGSDYHGSRKPHSNLGSSWVSEDVFQRLYAHYLSHSSL